MSDPSNAQDDQVPGRAAIALLAMGVFAVAWAWLLSLSTPRGDDLEYIRWVRELPAGAEALVLSHAPFPGHRPLVGLSWYLGVRWSDAWAAAVALTAAAAWLGGLFSWAAWVRARAGWVAATWMTALMLACPWFRDLPTWRSWITSLGGLAFIGATLWALERKRPLAAVVLGLVAVGFKETAAPVLVVAAVLVYRRPGVGLAVALAAAPGFIAFLRGNTGGAFLAGDLIAQTGFYAGLLGQSAWVPALAGAAWAPSLAAVGPVGVVLPVTVGALAVGAGMVIGLRHRSPWLWVVAASAALPILYSTRAPQYMLEGLLVVAGLAACALGRGMWPAWVGWFALAPAAWTWAASLENAQWQRGQWQTGQEILEELSDAPPGVLHVGEDVHDLGRFVAFALAVDQGWTTVDTPQEIEVCHGLTRSDRATGPGGSTSDR